MARIVLCAPDSHRCVGGGGKQVRTACGVHRVWVAVSTADGTTHQLRAFGTGLPTRSARGTPVHGYVLRDPGDGEELLLLEPEPLRCPGRRGGGGDDTQPAEVPPTSKRTSGAPTTEPLLCFIGDQQHEFADMRAALKAARAEREASRVRQLGILSPANRISGALTALVLMVDVSNANWAGANVDPHVQVPPELAEVAQELNTDSYGVVTSFTYTVRVAVQYACGEAGRWLTRDTYMQVAPQVYSIAVTAGPSTSFATWTSAAIDAATAAGDTYNQVRWPSAPVRGGTHVVLPGDPAALLRMTTTLWRCLCLLTRLALPGVAWGRLVAR